MTCKNRIPRVFQWFKNDWFEQIRFIWNQINPVYKKAFLWIFSILNVMFLFYTMSFMIGNHSWDLMRDGSSLGSQLWRGGFTLTIPDQLFFGQYLPVVYSCYIFLAMTLSVILLAHYWGILKTIKHYVIFGVFTSTTPYILAWLYYYGSIVFWTQALAVLALECSQRSIKKGFSWKYYLTTIILLFICFGGYPVVLSTVLVVFVGRCLLKYVFHHASLNKLLIEGCVLATQLLFALCSVKLVHVWLQAKSLMWKHGPYSGMTTPFHQMGEKAVECVKLAFSQLFISFPFIPLSYKIILFLLILTSLGALIVYILRQKQDIVAKKYLKLLTAVIILLIGLFLTKIIAFISIVPNAGTAPRFDFYGLRFFYALMVAILMYSGIKNVWSRNGLLLLMMILLPMHLYFNIYAQKVWKFGYDAEMKLINRIIGRIEQHPNFVPQKPYVILNIGMIPSMRKKYYPQNDIDEKEDTLLQYSFYPPWKSKFHPIDFFYSYNDVFESMDAINGFYICTKTRQVTLFVADLLFDAKLKAWPHANSVFIKDFVIVIVHSQSALDHLRKMILIDQVKNK